MTIRSGLVFAALMLGVATPLASLRCDPARVQAMQRFVGWTWVLMGLVYAVFWALMPLTAAEPLSMAVILFGTLVVAVRVLRLRRSRHGEA